MPTVGMWNLAVSPNPSMLGQSQLMASLSPPVLRFPSLLLPPTALRDSPRGGRRACGGGCGVVLGAIKV